ncbi:MAG TPA: hypothetical protein VK447_09930 [Myxococcaceae bacterium]|jgi:hypothetical protein|nr:hypothetical protein [Myxococcaceae bacterium]
MADASPPPYWVLISVLFSSVQLNPSLAMSLHQVAYALHRNGTAEGEVMQELARGKVRNLRKHLVLGEIAGPAFEAELETERGPGMVRFLLTRQGLELMDRLEDQAPKTMLN